MGFTAVFDYLMENYGADEGSLFLEMNSEKVKGSCWKRNLN